MTRENATNILGLGGLLLASVGVGLEFGPAMGLIAGGSALFVTTLVSLLRR